MKTYIHAALIACMAMGFNACSDDSPDEPVDLPDALGPFGVGHETLDVVDADREDRPLHIDIWYPVDPEV